jgi:hypothetical protein
VIKSARITAHVLPLDKTSYHAAVRARTFIIRLVKSAYFRTPLWRFLLPVMKFDKNIAHLSFIADAIRSVKVDGAVLEIGVGGGGTSIIINKFMEEESINRPFYAIDTFYGFTKEDVDLEIQREAKPICTLGIDPTVRIGTQRR